MKFISSILLLAVILLSGCKQDLQITTSNYVDTPVVYGLLNLYDFGTDQNTHYIRIQKGYLLKGNAYLAAGITDSIYYPDNLVVKLIGSNGYDSFTLTRIDGATVGLNQDTGIFANTPNYLYTFHHALDSSQTYALRITKNGYSDTLATSTVSMVNNLKVYFPSNVGSSTINFANAQPAVLAWSAANNAGVYDLTVRFFYKEFDAASNNLLKNTYIDIPVFSSYIPPATTTGNITYTLTSSVILTYLANNLANNQNVYREFNYMQFNFAAGGTALTSYYNTLQSQTGLTSSNALPPYTNISGGLGVLSSREYRSVTNIGLTPNGIDTLACDPTASFLNFRNSVGRICN